MMRVLVSAAGLAEQRDARKARAEVVVDVLGDAGPLFFDRALAFQFFHFLAKPPPREVTRRAPPTEHPRARTSPGPNHHVCQKCGSTRTESDAPCSSQTPSLLQDFTRKV